MIEDKIDADAQPEQSLAYRKRGKAGIDRIDWHRFTTCIVAPEWYLGAGPDVPGYDWRISLESVRDWLSTSDMEQARREFKLEILTAAISPSTRRLFSPQVWDEEGFVAALREDVSADAAIAAEAIIRWAERVGLTLDRGTARKPQVGFQNPLRFRLFTLVVDGKVQVHFPNIRGFTDEVTVRQTLFDALNAIPGVRFSTVALVRPFQNFPLAALTAPSSLQAFLSAMEAVVRR